MRLAISNEFKRLLAGANGSEQHENSTYLSVFVLLKASHRPDVTIGSGLLMPPSPRFNGTAAPAEDHSRRPLQAMLKTIS